MNTTSVLAVIAALAMIVSPLAIGSAFADNTGSQSISQSQSSSQNSFCVSGDDTKFSCNNFSSQFQWNEGNNALGQQDNDQ